MRNCLFPSHYYEFHSLLKMNFPRRLNEKKLNDVRKLLNLYKYHKNLNDILINSAIGDKIRDKIHLELRYLAPFWYYIAVSKIVQGIFFCNAK